MSLTIGSKLGPYEILSRIGAGGMGEVFKARDPRLDRLVAIKVAAAEFGERFEREARAVAALNHVNVCTLYELVSAILKWYGAASRQSGTCCTPKTHS